MKPIADLSLWDKIKVNFHPIKKTHQQREFPAKLRVHKKACVPLANVLDLHHQTVQEAYLSTQDFIKKHTKLGTKNIQIITGKGRMRQGAIRAEFEGWLDTPKFQKYIQTSTWTNDKGAINLCLKKHK